MAGILESGLAEIIKPLVAKIDSLTLEVQDLKETLQDRVPTEGKFWSSSQLAKKLGLKPVTIRGWIHAKKIETVEVNGKRRIPDSEVRRILLNANRP